MEIAADRADSHAHCGEKIYAKKMSGAAQRPQPALQQDWMRGLNMNTFALPASPMGSWDMGKMSMPSIPAMPVMSIPGMPGIPGMMGTMSATDDENRLVQEEKDAMAARLVLPDIYTHA